MDRTHGIQTILMTDVVGSTRLWAAHPSAMPRAIERLEALAEESVQAEGGRILKRRGEGDSLFCLFPHPAAAVRASTALVRAMSAEVWPDDLTLALRAAVHCGPAQLRDDDLFGPLPNRCARLREVAHGSQILLSGAARGQIAASDGIAFRELGRHRLRDLDEPESIAQVLADGLPTEFPPLRSLTSLRNNLPIQTTSFVGREALRRDLMERLESDRLTTLTGAGGCGKTRLSLQLGADGIDRFPDGVWFVELAEVADEPAIVRAIGEACGFRDLPDGDVRALADRLRGRALFLLDNAEHALGPIGRVVAALVAAAPDLRFVVTSREPLRLKGERVHRVPPLSVPFVGCADPEIVAETEAGALFLDRARLHLPEFALRLSNAQAVGEIARRLDGIPLCLEMAASHVGYLGADQIAARLNDRFALLEGDDADAPPRHRTMRETIAWQYDGLVQEEKILLQRLAAFVGSFTLDAAEIVGSTDSIQPERVLRHLRALVEKSLVVALPDGDEMRYRLLETIAQFAMDQPEAETEAAMSKLFEWASAQSSSGYEALYGKQDEVWSKRLDQSIASIGKALVWGTAAGRPEVPKMVVHLTRYWHLRGRYNDGLASIESVLRKSVGEDRVDLLNAKGVFSKCVGDSQGSVAAYREVLRSDGLSPQSRGRCLSNLAITLSHQSLFEDALVAYDESIALLKEVADPYGERLARYNRALILVDLGRYREAIAGLLEAYKDFRDADDKKRSARCKSSLALANTHLRLWREAALHLRDALSVGADDAPADFYISTYLVAAALATHLDLPEESACLYFGAMHLKSIGDVLSTTRILSLESEVADYLQGQRSELQSRYRGLPAILPELHSAALHVCGQIIAEEE